MPLTLSLIYYSRVFIINATAFFCVILSLPALAVETQSPSMSSVWRVVLSLIFIIAFIPACIWIMKRFQLTQMRLGQSDIKIVSVQSLGAKEKLMLVEVEGQKMLIGVTAQMITHLRNLPNQGKGFQEILENVDQEHMNTSHSKEAAD